MKDLIRRTIEIDYTQKHRHAGGALSALPIIAKIYEQLGPDDVFILSKGHAAPAFYAVLEKYGYKPDVSLPHPDHDPKNGIVCTTGSLGHGLPVAVGIALAKMIRNEPGKVYVLIGDGESLEGTTWEALNIARAFDLHPHLEVHVDANGWQGSCETICDTLDVMRAIFWCRVHHTKRGEGVRLFEDHEEWHTHLITPEEFNQIMEELR